MLIGSSQVNITPETSFAIQGHYYLRTGKKILDPLYASCVVMDDGEHAVAIISCDLVEIQEDAISVIRAKINAETGLELNNIIITVTHTHQGPIMRDERILPWCVRDEKYSKILENIALAAIEAYSNRKPGRIGYGRGEVERCGFNRRYIMTDGKSHMNPKRGDNPDRLMVEGPVDKAVQVVWFEDLAGNLMSILVHFTGHPVTLIDTEFVSGDYPGAMRSNIQTIFGEIPVLFLQGASGNIDTYDFENDENWGEGVDGYQRIGKILAGEVMKILSGDRAEEKTDGKLSITNKVLQLPYKEIPDEELAKVKKAWEGKSDEELERMPFDEKVYGIRLLHLNSLKQANSSHAVEIAAFKLNDIVFVTSPGEMFVEYQLALKIK